MKFVEITEEQKAFPGEFLYHEPTSAIVMCGAFMGDKIKALNNGKLFEDVKSNFKKIQLTKEEKKKKFVSRCKACSKQLDVTFKRAIMCVYAGGTMNDDGIFEWCLSQGTVCENPYDDDAWVWEDWEDECNPEYWGV